MSGYNISFAEYEDQMAEYAEKLRNDYTDELWAEVNAYQRKYLKNELEFYESFAGIDNVNKVICDLLSSAISGYGSGNVKIEIEANSIEEAEDIEQGVWNQIGEYFLDSELVIEDNHIYIDVMFGGYFYAEWDGWWDG